MWTPLMLVSNRAVTWALWRRTTRTFKPFHSVFFPPFVFNPKSSPRTRLQATTPNVQGPSAFKKEGECCTLARLCCCGTVFQSSKDLCAHQLRTPLRKCGGSRSRGRRAFPRLRLFRARRAPFKGSPAWRTRGYTGRQLVPSRWLSALLWVMRQERIPPNQLSRFCCITLPTWWCTALGSHQPAQIEPDRLFSCNSEAPVLMDSRMQE